MDILAIATLLGGFAAIFYFWERIAYLLSRNKQNNKQLPKESDTSRVTGVKLDQSVSFYDKMREIAANSPYEAILHSWSSTEASIIDFTQKAGSEVGDNPPIESLIEILSRSGLIDSNLERCIHNLYGIRNETITYPTRFNFEDAIAYIDLAAKTIVALNRKIIT